MKPLQFFLLIVFVLSAFIASAQIGPNCTIKYTYDAAGNRIKKYEQCGALKTINPNITDTAPIDDEDIDDNAISQLSDDDLDIAVLFPNPTSSTCIVSLNKEVTNATLALYDNQAKMVHHERVSGKDIPLNLSGFSAGTYFVIINTENKSVHKTVVKN